MVQASHAALEAGLKFPYQAKEPSSLIVIGVKNQYQLEKARREVEEAGIRTEMFYEPDWDYGNTAFGTEAITEDQRHTFRRYNLWKA